MNSIEVNYFVRLMSSVYVYFWIPIRLNYLRLKFKLRPMLTVISEVFAITTLITTGVPLSIVYMFAKALKHLIKIWVITLCKIIEKTTGIDSKILYNSVLSDENLFDELTEEETINEHPIDNTVNESDDKNEQENTE